MTADGKTNEGVRSPDRAPFLVTALLLVLGLSLTVTVVTLRSRWSQDSANDRATSPAIVAPPREAPLVTRLAVILLQDLGDEVFLEPGVMPTIRDCRERGAADLLPAGGLRWRLSAGGADLSGLLEVADVPRLAHGGVVLGADGITLPPGDRASGFDEAIFVALDTRSWQVLLAGLAPQPALASDTALFLPGTRNPTEACFALSALDHELRRLLLHVGSHLTLLVVREGTTRADWTLSGPGADDPSVLEAMNEGAVARGLALLLGFAID